VAALKRAQEQDLTIHPGEYIEYVIGENEKDLRERIALAHEEGESYDASYYETQLNRAVEGLCHRLTGTKRRFVENPRRRRCRS
jgi:DNA polymerase I